MTSSESVGAVLLCGCRAARLALVAATLSATTLAWAEPAVGYLAIDLPDTTAGEDLWAQTYTLSGPLGVDEWLNLVFSPLSYGDVMATGWDATLTVLELPPILETATDGLVQVSVLDPLPAAAVASLSVQFVWRAPGAPGAQQFEVLDADFNQRASGLTSPVPEVSSAALLFAGLLGVAACLRRRPRPGGWPGQA